jgi:uncharacterized membrane protein
MARRTRLGAKTLHDLASIGFGGALAACLVINLNHAAFADPAAARQAFDAIARYVLVPSMVVVVVSGLIALGATHSYQSAGWAWAKTLLGLSVFEATLLIGGSSRRLAELASNTAAEAGLLDTLLRSERNTLWLLIAVSVVNVVLAVWRPRLSRGT